MLFTRLVTLFNSSVGQYRMPKKESVNSILCKQWNTILDPFDDKELMIIEGVDKEIGNAKEKQRTKNLCFSFAF